MSPARPPLSEWAFGAEVGSAPAERAAVLTRGAILQCVANACAELGEPVLVVKGAALATLVYQRPTWRPMNDIDLLVAPHTLRALAARLEHAGFQPLHAKQRRLTEASLELVFDPPAPLDRFLVEVHGSLDKVVPRRIEIEELVARAKPLVGSAPLLTPCLEDHLLLVVIHLASDEFEHRAGFADLEALIENKVDLEQVVQRARRWNLGAATFVALSALERLRPGLVPRTILDPLRPSALRRVAIARFFDLSRWPVARTPVTLGVPWLIKQTALRDDLSNWTMGLARYGAQRIAERLLGDRTDATLA